MLKQIHSSLINASNKLSAKSLSWIFLLLATSQAIFLIAATPPYQTADATTHFFRAYQLWEGAPLKSVNGNVGADLDTGIVDLYHSVDGMFFNYQTKFTRDRFNLAKNAVETGEKGHVSFPNTAQYSFLGYIPQLSVLYLTPGHHRKVWKLYELMCAANAIAAILLTFLAIRLGGAVAPILFAVGLLPETLSLYASVSQDASLISLSLLLCALLAHSIAVRRYNPYAIAGTVALAFVITTGRPPYIALLLSIFCAHVIFSRSESQAINLKHKIIAFSGVLASGLAVSLSCIIHANGGIKLDGVDPKQQFLFLVSHPLDLAKIVINTLEVHSSDILHTMIGDFGWLDAPLPNFAIYAGALFLLAAFIVSAFGPPELPRRKNIAPIISATICAMGISLAQYVTWTKVGAPDVEGIAGRYLLPLLPFAGISISSFGLFLGKIDVRLPVALLRLLIVSLPFLLAYETISCILLRYYI
jgi:uncharacterized membrane protein